MEQRAREPAAVTHILLVNENERESKRIQAFLERQGFQVFRVGSAESAYNVLDDGHVDVLVAQVLGEHIDGLRLLNLARRRDPETCVVLIARQGDLEQATQAMDEGAYDFQTRPVNLEKLVAVIRKGLEHRRLAAEVADLTRRLDKKFGLHNILGNSTPMVQVSRKIMQAAANKATVLLQGETGTGKDLVANAIHHNSPRRNSPFVKLNCAAVSEGDVEAELFGYEKGAFSRAVQARKGRFEIANGGSLFLDEIETLSGPVQAKLTRVLERQEIERVGGTRALRVDTRLIAATNEDLRDCVQRGSFRDDLYYLLNVVKIEIPPLRQRRRDIPLLIDHFLEEANREHGKSVTGLTRRALNRLQHYPWPGNVRELKNVVTGIALSQGTGEADLDSLPGDVRSAPPPLSDIHLRVGMSMKEIEKTVIQETLSRNDWNRQVTADILGIGLRTLYRKIKEYDLRPEREPPSIRRKSV